MPAPNYRILMSYDPERKVFTARAPELEHCSAEGATRSEAITRVEEEIDAQVRNMLASGSNPPSSVDEQVYSGEVALKLSRELHRDLVWQAHSEGVEVNQLASELFAAALEQRRQGRSPRSGNRQQGEQHFNGNHGGGRPQGRFGGQHYPGIMDDRANFIEYVRGLEQGGGHHQQQPGRGPGGGSGRRRRGRGPSGPANPGGSSGPNTNHP